MVAQRTRSGASPATALSRSAPFPYDQPVDFPPGIGATAIVDGNSASGSGLFYEDRQLQETRFSVTGTSSVREGTFSVTCPSS